MAEYPVSGRIFCQKLGIPQDILTDIRYPAVHQSKGYHTSELIGTVHLRLFRFEGARLEKATTFY